MSTFILSKQEEWNEFESLPPALKRKFFSNAERLRMRLGRNDGDYGFGYQSNLTSVPGRLHFRPFRSRPYYSPFTVKYLQKKGRLQALPIVGASQKLRSPGLPQVPYLATQTESQCFHSLPPKIQQKHFSPEERAKFYQHHFESDVDILDAADEALYRLEQVRERRPSSCQSLPSESRSFSIPHSSTLYFDPSDSDSDGSMDEQLYDSFRWLEEEGDLDLSLDEYNAHGAKSTSTLPTRRRPSYRKALSSNSANLGRRATLSGRTSLTNQSSTMSSSLVNIVGRHSTSQSRPSSSQKKTCQTPRSSTSSIDASAQYYQDPEARLKLRVYLASPQKFDEAIEFGFPALKNKENSRQERQIANPSHRSGSLKFTGTFLEDEDTSIMGGKSGRCTSTCGIVYPVQGSQFPQSPSLVDSQRQVRKPGPSLVSKRTSGNREMTLKMTLTRPDLRTDSPAQSPALPPSMEGDPLKLEDLPPAVENPPFWETGMDEQGLMKKMLRRFRRRKN